MNLTRRALAITIAACLLTCALPYADAAKAQTSDFPNQPIRMIVPYAPGGASDFLARIAAPKMSALLGQQVVVDNRSGGNGNVGMDFAARAEATGYTLFLGDIGAIELNPHFFADLRVKPLRDFIPITPMTETPFLLVANPEVPAKSAKELIDYVKGRPGKVGYATPGASTLDRLVMERFRGLAGLEMNHVPYGGGAGPAATDVMGGHVSVMFGTISSLLPHVQSGRLRAFAISSAERHPALPEIPTVAELGYPQATGVSWQGLLVPAGTPKPIVEKLHKVAVQVMSDPEVKSRIAERGGRATSSPSPEAFREFIIADEQKWLSVIKENGIKAE